MRESQWLERASEMARATERSPKSTPGVTGSRNDGRRGREAEVFENFAYGLGFSDDRNKFQTAVAGIFAAMADDPVGRLRRENGEGDGTEPAAYLKDKRAHRRRRFSSVAAPIRNGKAVMSLRREE